MDNGRAMDDQVMRLVAINEAGTATCLLPNGGQASTQ